MPTETGRLSAVPEIGIGLPADGETSFAIVEVRGPHNDPIELLERRALSRAVLARSGGDALDRLEGDLHD